MHDLQRFVAAQAPIYDQVVTELRDGTKRSHWMWFVFPQLAGLGHSPAARHYAIADRAHALAYLSHPLLNARLHECAALLNRHGGLTAEQIFGYPDCLKLHSCLTLFNEVAPDDPVIAQALQKYFGGEQDQATLRLLREA